MPSMSSSSRTTRSPTHLVLASTNDYAAVRGMDNRRLESRFKCLEVSGPDMTEAAAYLRRHFRVSAQVAAEIIKGALPDNTLGFDGVNMRQAIEDTQIWL